MPHMSESEVDAFLAEPGHLCRLATVDASGFPYVQPLWFLREQGRILVSPRERSLWLEHIREDPRVCLSIDEQVLPHRKLTVRARARIAFDVGRDAEWLDVYRQIVRRYWDAESGEQYIDSTKQLSRALVEIPYSYGADGVTNWRSIEDGDEYAGIWASRYWIPYTAGREQGSGPAAGQSAPRGR